MLMPEKPTEPQRKLFDNPHGLSWNSLQRTSKSEINDKRRGYLPGAALCLSIVASQKDESNTIWVYSARQPVNQETIKRKRSNSRTVRAQLPPTTQTETWAITCQARARVRHEIQQITKRNPKALVIK